MMSLPHAPTSFVGRTRERLEIRELMRTSRLVTLLGPGGVGKTRLAIEIADELRGSFQGQVHLCELAEIDQAQLVPGAVADALGIVLTEGAQIGHAVAAQLGHQTRLVVLDNCEHVRSAVAELLANALTGTSPLRVLATSRERLRVSGELVYPLHSLPASDAEQLLVDRTRRHDPEFRVTDSNRHFVSEICARLEGLPLALELTAPKLAILPPAQLAGMLESALVFRSDTRRETRHQTMEAALRWSFDLLSGPQRNALLRLSLFRAGFGLDAASRVLDTTELQALEMVSELRDRSLLTADTSGAVARFRMLEPVRQFAAAELRRAGLARSASRRHAQFVLERVTELDARLPGLEEATALREFDELLPDVHAAFDWAVDQKPATAAGIVATPVLWDMSGRAIEGEPLLRRALETNPAARERLRITMAVAMTRARRMLPPEDFADEALRLSRQFPPDRDSILARIVHGVAYMASDLARAEDSFDEAAALASESGHTILANWAIGLKAVLLVIKGEIEAAREAVDSVSALTRDEDFFGRVLWFFNSADVAIRQRDYATARRHTREALTASMEVRSVGLVPPLLDLAAAVAAHDGMPRESLALVAAAEKFAAEFGIPTDDPQRQQDAVSVARSQLSAAAAERALAEGAKLPLKEALELARRVVSSGSQRPATALSRRELEIARLVAAGHANKEIAALLHLSTRTVENHLRHVMDKLDIPNRARLAAWTTEHGLTS